MKIFSRYLTICLIFGSNFTSAQILDTLYENPRPCDFERLGTTFLNNGDWIYFKHGAPTTQGNNRELSLDLNSFNLSRGSYDASACDSYSILVNDSVFVEGCNLDTDLPHKIKWNNSAQGPTTLHQQTITDDIDKGYTEMVVHDGLPLLIGFNDSFPKNIFPFIQLDLLLNIQDTLNYVDLSSNEQFHSGTRFYQKNVNSPISFYRIYKDSLRLELFLFDSMLNISDTFDLVIESLPIPFASTMQEGIAKWGLEDMGDYYMFHCHTDGYFNLLKFTKDLQFTGWKISVPYGSDSCYYRVNYPNTFAVKYMDLFGYFQDLDSNWILFTKGAFYLEDNPIKKVDSKILKYSKNGTLVWDKCIPARPPHPSFNGCIAFFNGYNGSSLKYGAPLSTSSYVFIGTQNYGRNHDWSDIRVLVLDSSGAYNNPIGLGEPIKQPKVKLYPNPSNGFFNIELSELQQTTSVQIIDGLGRLQQTMTLAPGKTQINTQDWAHGVYHLSFQTGEVRFSETVVVE